jgi:truncated hemoglobin YjbI
VVQVVSSFYRRVLDSPQIGHYFNGVAIERLIGKQADFIEAAVSGKSRYSNEELGELHRHLKVTDNDFDEMVRLLVDTLDEFGIDRSDIELLRDSFLSARDHIVVLPRA